MLLTLQRRRRNDLRVLMLTALLRTPLAAVDAAYAMGVPLMRVNILTSISGVTREEAHAGRMSGSYGYEAANSIGKNECI